MACVPAALVSPGSLLEPRALRPHPDFANLGLQTHSDSYAHYSWKSLDQVAHKSSLLVVPKSLYDKVTGLSVPRDYRVADSSHGAAPSGIPANEGC